MKPSKICHISTMTRWGGVERILLDLLTQTPQKHFVHSLLTTSNSPAIISPLQELGIETFEPSRRWHYDPSAIVQMAKWMRSQKIEIAHGYNAQGNAWGYLAAMLSKVPIFIGGEHGSVWRVNSGMYWLNRLAYKRANLIVANSNASKALVCRRYKVDKRKVKVVYNIVAPSKQIGRDKARSRLGFDSEVVIGSIGRLAYQKGYTIFIDAAKEVLKYRTNVKFLIIGGGEEQTSLLQQVQNAGIGDNIIFTGWREDARELLESFDVFVSTSIFEPFGNVFVEAAMAGVPIIAPKVDGIPEAVEADVTGKLLYPTKPLSDQYNTNRHRLPLHVVIDGELQKPMGLDSLALANTIIEFIDNQDMRRAYGQAGRERANHMFTVEQYINQMQQIYSDLFES